MWEKGGARDGRGKGGGDSGEATRIARWPAAVPFRFASPHSVAPLLVPQVAIGAFSHRPPPVRRARECHLPTPFSKTACAPVRSCSRQYAAAAVSMRHTAPHPTEGSASVAVTLRRWRRATHVAYVVIGK